MMRRRTLNKTEKYDYIVTVDGREVARGLYNTLITVSAKEISDKKFVGWKYDGIIISDERFFQFYLCADMALTTVYVDINEDINVEPMAVILNVFTDLTDGIGSVSFSNILFVPKGYTVEEFGIYWTGRNKTNVPTLVNEDGTVCAPATKSPATVRTSTDQFSSTIKNIPAGKTARAVAYMKVNDGTTTRWVTSIEKSGTVEG